MSNKKPYVVGKRTAEFLSDMWSQDLEFIEFLSERASMPAAIRDFVAIETGFLDLLAHKGEVASVAVYEENILRNKAENDNAVTGKAA